MMTIVKFEKMLSVYGANLSRWPEADMAAARALLAESQDARNRYKQAEALDRALDAFAPPPLPAGLAVRAANESLLRARSAKKRSGFRLPSFSFGGPWLPAAGLVAVTAAVVLMVMLPHRRTAQPEGQDVAEIGSFIQSIDQQASADEQQARETDDMLALLDTARESAPPPPPANPDGGGVTSDELMKTLFDDDGKSDNDDSWMKNL